MKRICEIKWNGKTVKNDFGKKKILYLYFFEQSPFLSHEIVGNALPHSIIAKAIFGARIISLQSHEKSRYVFWKRKMKMALSEYVFIFPFQKMHRLFCAGVISLLIVVIFFFSQANRPLFSEKELFQEIIHYVQEENEQQAHASFVLLKALYPHLNSLHLIDVLLLKMKENR
ncbi:MAG: hypothetical protein COX62_06435 [Deltaproteobacteria bacterium CG_4_10_14_0_2_um_filter_43_8]|nr:MAG: hypothetical protein COV43_07380 [Deltaproteobacteria bacterium CG11_big_fil_rev_8_21_14_0_20_42_23]PJA19553.1 MAG: hypothetical protein COX62_06435 [Deltaproteobacteria bacterium CG_4_10_14_0_2_um_filter_43_8]PJC63928.1 MAG: hypothetical protein CO021_06875 [Deltaproteobacteria bacterium CG_4_9_14_0_2_um_filter_42_21]